MQKSAQKQRSNQLDWFYKDVEKTAVELSFFWIPETDRKKGLGKSLFHKWIAELPKSVTYIQLFAAETGDEGRSNGFWESMGFEYLYESLEAEHESALGIESAYTMFKNINGGDAKAVALEDWYGEDE